MNETITKYLIKNMIFALYSKKITNVLNEHQSDYDYAIFIRPDTLLYYKNIKRYIRFI
jgi:hypothetical protein